MIFINSVTRYSVDTAKARPIQAIASQFEHTMLEEVALESLVANLRLLVDICNRYYRGNTLELHHHPGRVNEDGQISVRYPATGYEKPVVSISYSHVLCSFRLRSEIREEIQKLLGLKYPKDCARYLVEYTQKGGEL